MGVLKRRASSSGGSDTKRKCVSVAKALTGTQELSDSCKTMLSGMSTFALETFQEERHPWQFCIMEMVADTLSGLDAAMSKSSADAQSLVGTAGTEKKKRNDAVSMAESTLQDKVESVAAKKAAADESATALQVAKAAFADATLKQSKGDAELKLIADKKDRLEFFKRNAFVPLKEGGLRPAEANSALKIVASVSKQFDLEKPMVKAALECLKKALADRTAFLVTSVSQMEEKIDGLITTFGDQLTQGEPAKQERAAAVSAADVAKAEALVVCTSCATALHDAQTEKKQAGVALKAAQLGCANFLPDMKKLMDDFDNKKASQQQFRSTVMVDFEHLQTLAPPPPPPIEEEPVEEPAANEAAGTAVVPAEGA